MGLHNRDLTLLLLLRQFCPAAATIAAGAAALPDAAAARGEGLVQYMKIQL